MVYEGVDCSVYMTFVVSVLISLLGHAPSFLGQFSHGTTIVAPSLKFVNVLKSSYLVLFSSRKNRKFKKKEKHSQQPVLYTPTVCPMDSDRLSLDPAISNVDPLEFKFKAKSYYKLCSYVLLLKSYSPISPECQIWQGKQTDF